MVTPVFLLSFWAVSTAATFLIRIGMRYTLNGIRRSGRNLRYLLIVGTNSRAVQFARKIESQPELGYVIAGFVDDQWKGNRGESKIRKIRDTILSNRPLAKICQPSMAPL